MSRRAPFNLARAFANMAALLPWAALVALPLAGLYLAPSPPPRAAEAADFHPLLLTAQSLGLCAAIAAAAVALGYLPGKLLGGTTGRRGLVLAILLINLLLPPYVLFYAWSLLLSPMAPLGMYVSQRPALAQLSLTLTSSLVMILWCWPLAALLIAQGWRAIDAQVWQAARLESSRLGRWLHITLPLMARPLAMALGVCLVLTLSDFATFHLAGIKTLGTELSVMFELTGSAGYVARAALPLLGLAAVMGLALWKKTQDWSTQAPLAPPPHSPRLGWAALLTLTALSLLGPMVMLITNAVDPHFGRFFALHGDDLLFSRDAAGIDWQRPGSLPTAALAAAVALAIAAGALSVNRRYRLAGALVVSTIFMAAFLPGSLIAVGILRMASLAGPAFAQSALLLPAGLGVRFAGIVLIVLQLGRDTRHRQLADMAALDGASRWQAWRRVHLPAQWPLLAGAVILVMLQSLTELSSTMVLLPPGVPNFAQRLLNQMHYARDQQVIASILILVGVYALLGGTLLAFFTILSRRLHLVLILALAASTLLGGCKKNDAPTDVKILASIGQTGHGDGEFIYPRAIDRFPDGVLVVADKTGRIQLLRPDGTAERVFSMPAYQTGKPTGLSVGPDGLIYVADTHYSRITVFDRKGQIVRQWGRYGTGDGEFMFPTDIAFAPDGRIFVSEYGGNDRVSIFDAKGKFLSSFGTFGSDRNQFSRPAALAIDAPRDRLYVADACNHRIAVYNLRGTLQGYLGSAGMEKGQLRYPYGLALLSDGTLAVCEYGNNRIQLLDSQGRCRGLYGTTGRLLGQLAYPWALVVDERRRAYIVDSGNNRLQVWQL